MKHIVRAGQIGLTRSQWNDKAGELCHIPCDRTRMAVLSRLNTGPWWPELVFGPLNRLARPGEKAHLIGVRAGTHFPSRNWEATAERPTQKRTCGPRKRAILSSLLWTLLSSVVGGGQAAVDSGAYHARITPSISRTLATRNVVS